MNPVWTEIIKLLTAVISLWAVLTSFKKNYSTGFLYGFNPDGRLKAVS